MLEVAAAGGKNLGGLFRGDEGLGLHALSFSAVAQRHVFAGVVLTERGAGLLGGIDEQHRGSPVFEGGVELGALASVHGKSVAEEEIRDRRIAGQHHDRLACHLAAGIVIPLVFRSHHTVAGEDHVGIADLDQRVGQVGPHHEVARANHGDVLAAATNANLAAGAGADQGHRLHEAALRRSGLEADRFDLRKDVRDAFFFAWRAGKTPGVRVG